MPVIVTMGNVRWEMISTINLSVIHWSLNVHELPAEIISSKTPRHVMELISMEKHVQIIDTINEILVVPLHVL